VLRVIYTDVDGSLLGRGGSLFLDLNWRPTSAPARALSQALSLGVEIVLVSGRSLPLLLEDARLLGATRVIAELGAIIASRTGEILAWNLGASPPQAKPPVQSMAPAEDLLLRRYRGCLEPHTPWTEGRQASRLYRGLIPLDEANSLLSEKGHGWLRLHDNGQIPRRYPGLSVPEVRAYHLVPVGVDKASAVLLDRRAWGIPREDAVAIGDSAADLAMAPVVSRLYMVGTEEPGSLEESLEEHPLAATGPGKPGLPRGSGRASAGPGVLTTANRMNVGWAEAVQAALREMLPQPLPPHLRAVLYPPSSELW
jgi:hypothetical protein